MVSITGLLTSRGGVSIYCKKPKQVGMWRACSFLDTRKGTVVLKHRAWTLTFFRLEGKSMRRCAVTSTDVSPGFSKTLVAWSNQM